MPCVPDGNWQTFGLFTSRKLDLTGKNCDLSGITLDLTNGMLGWWLVSWEVLIWLCSGRFEAVGSRNASSFQYRPWVFREGVPKNFLGSLILRSPIVWVVGEAGHQIGPPVCWFSISPCYWLIKSGFLCSWVVTIPNFKIKPHIINDQQGWTQSLLICDPSAGCGEGKVCLKLFMGFLAAARNHLSHGLGWKWCTANQRCSQTNGMQFHEGEMLFGPFETHWNLDLVTSNMTSSPIVVGNSSQKTEFLWATRAVTRQKDWGLVIPKWLNWSGWWIICNFIQT